MLVSFLMPVYNKEVYLAESIEAVLGQTHKELELIIVDDKSKDGSLDVAKHYAKADKRVKLVSIPKNMGVAFCRNFAREHAHGKILLVNDADDMSYRDRAENTVKFFEKNPEVDMCYGHARAIDQNLTYIGDRMAPDFSINQLKRENLITHSTVAFRSNLPTRYRPSKRYIDDWFFYLDVCVDGNTIELLPEFLSVYRAVPDGLTFDSGYMTRKKKNERKALVAEFASLDDDLSVKVKESSEQSMRMMHILQAIKSRTDVLDAGCNGGYLMKHLLKKGCRVKGIDIATNLVEKCRRDGLDVVRDSVMTHKPKRKYDYIVLGDILEHYDQDDMKKIVTRMLSNLTWRGEIIITVPYRYNQFGAEYVDEHVRNYMMKDFVDAFPKNKIVSKPLIMEGEAMPLWELIRIS